MRNPSIAKLDYAENITAYRLKYITEKAILMIIS